MLTELRDREKIAGKHCISQPTSRFALLPSMGRTAHLHVSDSMYRILICIQFWHISMPDFHNQIPIFPLIPHISRLPLSVHMTRNIYSWLPHCYLNIPFPRQFQSSLATSQAQILSLPVLLTPDSTSKSVYPFLAQLLSCSVHRSQCYCTQGSWWVSEQQTLKLNHR